MSESGFIIDECYKLIVTIIKRGTASGVVAASKKAGAKGGTILLGRGTAKRSAYLELLGISHELEKEIILTVVKEDKADDVMQAIINEGKLTKPGNGIVFVVNIKGLTGIFHLLKIQDYNGGVNNDDGR